MPTAQQTELCLVDSNRLQQDCGRSHVDFRVLLQTGTIVYATRATEICGAGIYLTGDAPLQPGDQVQLRLAIPGLREELKARAVVRTKLGDRIGCEIWAANSYEQQFLDEFVRACKRRQTLRAVANCEH